MTEQHKPDPEFVQYFEDKIRNPFIPAATMMRMEQVYIDQRNKYAGMMDSQVEENERLQMANMDAVAWEKACKHDIDQARQIIANLVEYSECNDPGNPHLGRAKGFLSGG